METLQRKILSVMLTRRKKYPPHGLRDASMKHDKKKANAIRRKGMRILVYASPEPNQDFQCGVPSIWRVLPSEVERITGSRYENVFVCEHQIQKSTFAEHP